MKYTGCTPASSARADIDGASGSRSRSTLRSSHAGRRPRLAGLSPTGPSSVSTPSTASSISSADPATDLRSPAAITPARPGPTVIRSPRQGTLLGQPLRQRGPDLEVEAPPAALAEPVRVHLVRLVEDQRARPARLPPRAPGLLERSFQHQAEVGRPVRVLRDPRPAAVAPLRQRDLARGAMLQRCSEVASPVEQVGFVQAPSLTRCYVRGDSIPDRSCPAGPLSALRSRSPCRLHRPPPDTVEGSGWKLLSLDLDVTVLARARRPSASPAAPVSASSATPPSAPRSA